MGYDFNMKVLILVALLALALAKPDGERRPRPRPDDGDEDRPRPPRPDPPRPEPKGPAIFTKRVHKVAVGDDLVFSFAVASNQEEALDTSKVLLMKVSRGENGPDFAETDFAIKMKALTQEEIKEYYDQKKAEIEKKKDDMEEALKCMEPEPRPRPFKQVIVGKVAAEGLGPARVVDLSFSWTGARPMMRWSQYLYQKDLLRKENERMVKVAADLNQMVTRMEKTERMVVKQTR